MRWQFAILICFLHWKQLTLYAQNLKLHKMTMIQENFVSIRNIAYGRALLLKMRLEMEGVICFLTNIHQIESGADINLPEADIEKAYDILEELKLASGSEKELMVKKLKSVRRILVPIDFSPLSIKAAHYALELARTLKADIRLLNVWFNNVNEGFVFNEMFAFQTNLDTIMNEMADEIHRKMAEVIYELRCRIRDEKIRGVEVDFDLIRGSAVEAILEIVDDYKPGLVVMGTHGKNREGIGLIGSTTAKVIENCKVPVLAVPQGYNVTDFIAPKNIAYITNFDDTDFRALHRLIAFVRPFNVKIFCVHIQLKDSKLLDNVKMKKMRQFFNECFSEFDIECGIIETPDLLSGIESFIDERKIDVISLITRKRNLLTHLLAPSLTRKLLFQSDIPILIFNESIDVS